MDAEQPVLVYFPQWQGAGLTHAVQTGARTLLNAFPDEPFLDVPLSDEPLTSQHNISGYQPLLTQLATATARLDQTQPAKILSILGDCGAEVAPIAYLNGRNEGRLTVLWLDAHADLNTPDSSPSGHFHGMPLRLLLEGNFANTGFRVDKPLEDRQVIFVGLRDTDQAEDRYIEDRALPVLTDTDFTLEKLKALLGQQEADKIYIHLDLDVLNPLHFPALQYPTPGGIEISKIAELIHFLVDAYPVVGVSLTESTATTLDDLRPIESILMACRKWLDKAIQ